MTLYRVDTGRHKVYEGDDPYSILRTIAGLLPAHPDMIVTVWVRNGYAWELYERAQLSDFVDNTLSMRENES